MIASEEPTLQEKLVSNPKLEKSSLSTFLRNLYAIVENQDHNDIISWTDQGDAIFIKDQAAFGEKILPAYFKHCKLASFIRQMNMYQFRKRKNSQYEHVFAHPYFLEGRSDLLGKIRRKLPVTASEAESKTNHKPIVKNQTEIENPFLKEENIKLKQKQSELEQKIHALETKNIQLMMQNQAYIQEIRQKTEVEEYLKNLLNSVFKKESTLLSIHDVDSLIDRNLLLMGINSQNNLSSSSRGQGVAFAQQGVPGRNTEELLKFSNNTISTNQNFSFKNFSRPDCNLKVISGLNNLANQEHDQLPQMLYTLSESPRFPQIDSPRFPQIDNPRTVNETFHHLNLGSALEVSKLNHLVHSMLSNSAVHEKKGL